MYWELAMPPMSRMASTCPFSTVAKAPMSFAI